MLGISYPCTYDAGKIMKPKIIRTPNLVQEALDLISRCEKEAVKTRKQFRLGLSGGNTPRPVYEALSKREDELTSWLFTFGDERCVPPDHKESNYRMVRECLFDLAPIPPENVLRMRGEDDPPSAASDYEVQLRAIAKKHGESHYRHDLLLLGMGDDGHTASLFPGTEALGETQKWVAANFVPKFGVYRVTLTYPVLNAARHVCFLVNTKGKGPILEEVLSGTSHYPCTRVQPTDGSVTWLLGE
jgi:6-phosphogluconolactonase